MSEIMPDVYLDEIGLHGEADHWEEGDFALINLSTKTTSKYFTGKVISVEDDNLKVNFLKKLPNSSNFIMEDFKIYDILLQDVAAKLPRPSVVGGSSRLKECFRFGVDFSMYKVE